MDRVCGSSLAFVFASSPVIPTSALLIHVFNALDAMIRANAFSRLDRTLSPTLAQQPTSTCKCCGNVCLLVSYCFAMSESEVETV